MRWHVQVAGEGPALLLLHGTGAATHSWRDLLPLLTPHFTVIAPDLPGHGFSSAPGNRRGYTLPGMAELTGALLRRLGHVPVCAAGHSAGAAILSRMVLDGHAAPRRLVSLNGALLPLPGMPVPLFLVAGRLMVATPLIPGLVARRAANPAMVRRLIDSTGSVLDDTGRAFYHQLVSNPGHVRDVLTMMANWDLRPLARDLPRLGTPLALVATGGDRTVPPGESRRVHRLVPGSELIELPSLGHLAHEERPREFADLLIRLAQEDSLTSSPVAGAA
jgi:magnesium chelatase accessory protein